MSSPGLHRITGAKAMKQVTEKKNLSSIVTYIIYIYYISYIMYIMYIMYIIHNFMYDIIYIYTYHLNQFSGFTSLHDASKLPSLAACSLAALIHESIGQV